ncbi:MAG: M81 family metallopeptidase [Planctomycetaceae bacterium]|nr:M81 family metallopeptidase [Planctomycetaceae bacterium]
MRIATAGWSHETNTFSTMPTRYEDFGIARGSGLVKDGFWQELAAAGHEVAGLIYASAGPAGRITKDAFDRIAGEMVEMIAAAMPLDALFMGLHGAMEVEEIGDGEGELLRRIRAVTGDRVFICGTLDLHGNLSPQFVHACDFLTAYRTAPHRDCAETSQRALKLMMQCLEQNVRPVTELIKLPLLLTGEWAVTEVEPAKSLYARLEEIDAVPGILTSSILIGCAWTDSPHTGVSVLVSGTDAAAVKRQARALAREIWSRREEFGPDMPVAEADATIAAALAAPEAPVFISDSGDNPTAGGGGDSTIILQRLIALGVKDAIVGGITDPAAVQACFAAGEGTEIDLSIGGKLDSTFCKPLAARVKIIRLVTDSGAGGPRALVATGGVEVVLQSDRWPFVMVWYFEKMGVDVFKKKIAVVKQGYLWPDVRDNAPLGLMALSPGYTDLRLDRLPFKHLKRPIWPLDEDAALQL